MNIFGQNAFSALAVRHASIFLTAICLLMFSAVNFAQDGTSGSGNAPEIAPNGVSNGVVISQVYGGAGCGTAGCSTYKNDYIELYNRGNTAISLNGWSVQYAAATGTAWQVTNLTNVTLQPGQYYLVAEGAGANGVNVIPTPDATGTVAMSATAAKVALVNTTTALSGACPSSNTIVDLVGYGATTSCFEGTGPAPAPGTTTADLRQASGSLDTDQNATDFTAAAPNPRNTSTFSTAATVSSANATTFSVGATKTFSVTTTGNPVVTTITEAGTLPTGITFTDNGNGTATLSGTAAAGTAGTYQITLTAFNGIYTVQTFTLTVTAPTAAGVSVSGNVVSEVGKGIWRASVMLSGGSLKSPIYTTTDFDGNFNFADIPAGETYVLSVSVKGYKFNQTNILVNLSEDFNQAHFIGSPKSKLGGLK